MPQERSTFRDPKYSFQQSTIWRSQFREATFKAFWKEARQIPVPACAAQPRCPRMLACSRLPVLLSRSEVAVPTTLLDYIVRFSYLAWLAEFKRCFENMSVLCSTLPPSSPKLTPTITQHGRPILRIPY
jgi:hypothetical protein